MQRRTLTRLFGALAVLLCSALSFAANWSNYGRLDPTPDGMIDLSVDQKVLTETDYQSAYPGFAVQRWKHLVTGKWRWKFDSFLGVVPYLIPPINQAAENFVTVQFPERQLKIYDDAATNRGLGIFERAARQNGSTATTDFYKVTHPATDTVTTFQYWTNYTATNSAMPSRAPVSGMQRYFVYRIFKERFRDGSSIEYLWDNTNDCSDLTVRHTPSGASYRVLRSAFATKAISFAEPKYGWGYCRVDSITLKDGSSITYGYGARVPADWTVGEPAYVRLNKVTLPDGSVRRYTHRTDTYSRTDPDKYLAVASVTDEAGNIAQHFTFDVTGRPVTSSRGGTRGITVTYNADGSRTVTDGDNIARKFKFATVAGMKRLTGISAPCQWCAVPHKSIEYDANHGLVSATTDFLEVKTTYARWGTDPRRRIKTIVEASGTADARTTTITWHATFNLPLSVNVADASGAYTNSYAYDDLGRETSRTFSQTVSGRNIFRTTTTSYVNFPSSDVAQTVTVRGPRTDIVDETIATYDAKGRLISRRNAAGHTTSYHDYDSHGRPQTIVYPNGLAAHLTYDWRGNLLSKSYDRVTSINQYYPNGWLQSTTTTPNDGSIATSATYSYDAAGRVRSVVDGAGNVVNTGYDSMGRRISNYVRDAAVNVNLVSEGYDVSYTNGGQTVSMRPALVPIFTEATLDAQYRVVAVTEPHADSAVGIRKRVTSYDALGRTSDTTDESGVVRAIDRDVSDSVSRSQYWPSAATPVNDVSRREFTYVVDGEGKSLSASAPDTGTTSLELDNGGNITRDSNTSGAPIWRSTYDSLGRPTLRAIVGSSNAQLGYVGIAYDTVPGDASVSAPGKLTALSGTFGDIVYRYESGDRVSTRSVRHPGGDWSNQSYSYDAAGRPKSMGYPSGRAVYYSLDSLGRVLDISTAASGGSVLSVASQIRYHPGGDDVRELKFGGTQPSKYLRDSLGRLSSYEYAARQYAVKRSLNGRIQSVNKTYGKSVYLNCLANGGPHPIPGCTPGWTIRSFTDTTEAYTYASTSGRLETASTAGVSRSYVHDAYGNLISGPSGTFSMPTANSNRISDYAYTAGGRVQNDGRNVLGYDIRGQLSSISNGTGTWTYPYDPEGRRASKTQGGYSIYYHYDATGNLIAERDSNGVWLREYVWLGARPLMVIVPANGATAESRYYIHLDHSGAAAALTDVGGNVVWEWQRGPYGEGAPTTTLAGFTFNLRMPGQYFDAESGYAYNGARYFDSRSGRFLQPDPAGEVGSGPALYAYAQGDPVNYIDPTGQFAVLAGWRGALRGAIVGGSSAAITSNGDPRSVAAGAAMGAVTGLLSPFGVTINGARAVSGTADVLFNAALSNVGAQYVNDPSAFNSMKTVVSVAAQSAAIPQLKGLSPWMIALGRGEASGAGQLAFNGVANRIGNDGLSPMEKYGAASFGASSLHDWSYESRFGDSPQMMTYMNTGNFYGGLYANPARVVGWPSGGGSTSAEEKLTIDIQQYLTPSGCTFCN